MISVFTLSPAIDITYQVANATLGEVNRVQKVIRTAGGKGLNVARLLTKLETNITLHAPLGGNSGLWIKNQLEQLSVNCAITEIANETRSALAIVSDTTTVFNEAATEVTESELQQMLSGVSQSDVIVVTGSIPKSVSVSRFGELLKGLKLKTKNLVVDTSGEYLVVASEHADYLKPNLEELLEATGKPKPEAIEFIRSHGAKLILSLGEAGVELHSDHITKAIAPRQLGNPTGAGDALTSGFVAKLQNSETEALKFGCALSAASVKNPIAGDFNKSDLDELIELVEVS